VTKSFKITYLLLLDIKYKQIISCLIDVGLCVYFIMPTSYVFVTEKRQITLPLI